MGRGVKRGTAARAYVKAACRLVADRSVLMTGDPYQGSPGAGKRGLAIAVAIALRRTYVYRNWIAEDPAGPRRTSIINTKGTRY